MTEVGRMSNKIMTIRLDSRIVFLEIDKAYV